MNKSSPLTSPGIRPRLRYVIGGIIATAVVGFGLLLCLSSTGRATIRSALLVTDILSGSPNTLLHLITQSAKVDEMTFPTAHGLISSKLYTPHKGSQHPALIMAIGVPSNINDPLLTRLSEDLARLGFVILIPQLPGVQRGELVPTDVEILVETFEWLSTQPEVDPDYIGYTGFCIGSSLALIASQDPRINERVALVNVFGGYFDLTSLLRSIAAHSSNYQGDEYPWQPIEQSVELFAQNALMYIKDPDDREILMNYYQGGMNNQAPLSGLSAMGKLIYSLLTTTNPLEVDALIKQIPAETKAQINAMSPKAGIARLKTKVFVMHDMSDPYVPITESYQLADAITNPDQIVYAKFVLFEHMIPNRPLDKVTLGWEAIRLIVYLGRLITVFMPNG